LRTRTPVVLPAAQLPSVLNHLEYRVKHVPSGLAGNWQDLQLAVATLPRLKRARCDSDAGGAYVWGEHLDLIDGVRPGWPDGSTGPGLAPVRLTQCTDGTCFAMAPLRLDGRLQVKVQWIDQTFNVRIPDTAACRDGALPAPSKLARRARMPRGAR
jgi:hypothetical protein